MKDAFLFLRTHNNAKASSSGHKQNTPGIRPSQLTCPLIHTYSYAWVIASKEPIAVFRFRIHITIM